MTLSGCSNNSVEWKRGSYIDQPKCMRCYKRRPILSKISSGIRQSAIFEQLYRVPLRENGLTAQTKQLIDFEVESLLGLDIPRFNVRLDSRDLRSLDFCAPELLRHKPLDTVTERIAAMGPEDLEFQVEVIQESLSRFPVNLERPLKQPQALSIAGRLADEIRLRLSPGSVSYLWEIPRYLPRSIGTAERQGVYLGDLGTLIFLAAADKLLEIRCFPEIAHLRDQLGRFSPSAWFPLPDMPRNWCTHLWLFAPRVVHQRRGVD